MSRSTEIEVLNDVSQPNETFRFREPIVLSTIMCLSLLNGITLTLQTEQNKDYMPTWLTFSVRVLCLTAAPVPGFMFCALLSDLHGRKPVFIILFAFSILISILNYFPWQETCFFLGMIFRAVHRGGISVMSDLSITEYCGAKHRFAYLLANEAFNTVGVLVPVVLIRTGVLSISAYLQSFEIVIGLVCLGLTCMWPESPYWLASKGKLEESREAFLWLRGEDGRKELSSVMEEHGRPGSTKFNWSLLFVATVITSVSVFSNLQVTVTTIRFISFETSDLRQIILLVSSVIFFFVTVVVSYFVRRKMLFVVIALAYSLTVVLLLFVRQTDSQYTFFGVVYFANDIFLRCGLGVFGRILFSEVIPQKYNTPLTCVQYVYHYAFYFLFYLFSTELNYHISDHIYFIMILPILMLVGVLKYYYSDLETKDKNLLEIQNMYYKSKPRSGLAAKLLSFLFD